jgi:hypothetical protein
MANRYANAYSTFAGADIQASFNGTFLGTLSGITWSITREKAPIYTMGSANPRSFSRGKRGIAGSLIFTIFDRPGLYDMIERSVQNNDQSMRFFTRASNVLPGLDGSSVLVNRGLVPHDQGGGGEIRQGLPYYADQIPPFDITISFLNEYGASARRSIYGVELLNEGSGVSMDDIVLEETMTFVATDVGPMYATGGPGTPSFDPGSISLNTNIIDPS